MVVEAEEQLFYGGGGFTIRSWRMKVEDGWGGQAGVLIIFSFLGKVESYLKSYLLNPTINKTVHIETQLLENGGNFFRPKIANGKRDGNSD